MDYYQHAVYSAIKDVIDESYVIDEIYKTVVKATQEVTRPFMVLQPKLYKDGDQWCALYGDNLQEGVAGFGNTPDEASKAFDNAWKGGA